MKKKGLIWKIPLGVVGGILGLFALTWGTLNAIKYAIYSDFYAVREKLGVIPDLNDGFTPQGICVNEEQKLVIMTGYQKDTSQASRIYVKGENINKYVEILTQDGEPFNGHNGGIANYNDYIYIADTDCHIQILSLAEILDEATTQVKISETITLVDEANNYKNEADFVFANDECVIVGEFAFEEKNYPCNNPHETKNGTYTAIAEVFNINSLSHDADFSKPIKAYSIPDKVQGFAMDENYNIVLSTSYGVADSHLTLYESKDIKLSEEKHHGDIDLFNLDTPAKVLKAPAMTEDLDYYYDSNDKEYKWISITESACDKYMFGKFFFANYFFSFTL